MLNHSRKQKGKRLEKLVASTFADIFPFAYSRADSGSGKMHKEDVTLPLNVPLHIECKNQATIDLKGWWSQTMEGCPAYKFPVLIYKLDFQQKPSVVMRMSDVLQFYLSNKPDFAAFGEKQILDLMVLITMSFDDFIGIVKSVYAK